MKCNIHIWVIVMSLLFLNENTFSQTQDWKTEKTDDGKITVKYCVSKRTAASGKEEQLVEYTATTTTSISMKKLISIVKDVSKHKEFMSQMTSLKVKTLTSDECLVYYFYKGFWPYPNSDIVARMIYKEDADTKAATFTLTAEPSLFEDKGVRRLDYYNLTYLFQEIRNGIVEITVSAKFTPAVQLPAFLTATWFPDGPAGYLSGIIKLANEVK